MDNFYLYYRSLVCTAADIYYAYLTKAFEIGRLSAGRNVITVHHVSQCGTPSEYIFYTDGRIKNPDECQIWINGVYHECLRIVSVRKVSNSSDAVRILDRSGNLGYIPTISPRDIQIISDLRFLIKKLRSFYEENYFDFHPAPPIPLPPLPHSLTEDLTDEQIAAVETVFSSPVSYIHGAPGTGKTAYVLSRCILRYVLAQKRVFLLAPTNNAVEQVLRGILPILEQSGIDLRTVYRLGSASDEFAVQYPQVVGNASKERILAELRIEEVRYSKLLSDALSVKSEYQQKAETLAICKSAHETICALLPSLHSKKIELEAAEIARISADTVQKEKFALRSKALQELRTSKDIVKSCEENIAAVQHRIHRIRYLFWKKSEKEKLSENRFLLLASLPSYRDALTSAQQSVCTAQAEYDDAQAQFDLCKSHCNALSEEIQEIITQVAEASQCHADYSQAVQRLLAEGRYDPSPLCAVIASLESECSNLDARVKSSPVEAYQQELAHIRQQLLTIGTSSKILQKRQALVLAGTIDAFLPDLASACHPEKNDSASMSTYQPVYHVFLDEAGYTSLARGLAAFAAHAPVTFLGDHNQLPPVCEMNRISSVDMPACLWALPISFYSELLNLDFPHLFYNCYQKGASPSFGQLAFASLNTSYRFGDTLAKILAQHIYKSGFHGVSNAPFEILCLDAPREQAHKKRGSLSECHVVDAYLTANPQSDFAILAPYNSQIMQLRAVLPDYRDNILTVHRAQGQEWDTVILSVVDTSDTYFTNSNLSIGRRIINTAVSRARRRLVIVCDLAFWKSHPDQLITKLLCDGTQIDPSGDPVLSLPRSSN